MDSSVFVLNEENENYYSDLLSKNESDQVYKFSTNDEVLSLLEQGYKGSIDESNMRTASILCGNGASSKYGTAGFTSPYIIRTWASYNKYGVYFELWNKFEHSYYTPNFNYYGTRDRYFYYKTNCKNYNEGTGNIFGENWAFQYHEGPAMNPSVFVYREVLYSSSRGLKQFRVKVTYMYRNQYTHFIVGPVEIAGG